MGKLFLGKISGQYPEQFADGFYAAGPAPRRDDDTYYGALRPGDFVFPVFQGRVRKLWRMDEFVADYPNRVNPNGVARFSTLLDYGEGFAVSSEFLRYPYFDLDLNLLNKSVKSAELGFFEISLLPNCPEPGDMNLQTKRKIIIERESQNGDLQYADMDIRVLVDRTSSKKIIDIQIWSESQFTRYEKLWQLYLDKNPGQTQSSLPELLAYAQQDGATKKEKYLRAVIDELDTKGYFIVTSPVALYDDILVGRKRSRPRRATGAKVGTPIGGAGTTEEGDQLDEADDSLDSYSIYNELLDQNPNLILYGPPGTGKTFALTRIIENVERAQAGVFKTFERIKAEKRVEFVTFHQSFSYEEFVEGIRPVMPGEGEETDEKAGLTYRTFDGIVKRIADQANFCQLKDEVTVDDLAGLGAESSIFKISLGRRHQDDSIYEDCRKSNEIAIGWLDSEDLAEQDYDSIYSMLNEEEGRDGKKPTNDASSIDCFVNQIRQGDIVFVYDGPRTIRDIAIVTGEYFHAEGKEYPHRRKVRWLKHFDEPFDILRMNGGTNLTMKTVYELGRIQFSDIRDILRTTDSRSNGQEKRRAERCFLVIDEINRGNISKIFGELITLIEKDKRDALDITLPYSRKPFRLPGNLYIIGTMNTADRSIAVLDTALRRRFIFKELEPDSEVIRTSDNSMIEDTIDLARLLDAVNAKILEKYDRDHRIGHSYFMEQYSLRQFALTWYYKIIPLLMEYFYNDGKTVAYIIGDSFVDAKTCSPKPLEGDAFVAAIKKIYGQ